MKPTVLITGGAGFIGSHVADALLQRGFRVRALDSLVPQVHSGWSRPPYLDRDVELMIGDVRDPDTVRTALAGVDAVFHFAARVGVAQSMYRVAEYCSSNATGTAVLMEALAERPIGRLVVASSMSVYGEGRYLGADGRVIDTAVRRRVDLARGQWDPVDEVGEPLIAVPTPETKPAALQSVYALTKLDQERLALILGEAYGIPTVALRLFNVYGTRQALSNPYTGVLAIFAARLLNGKPPLLFEDGEQRRDFVSVQDVARACVRALVAPDAAGGVFNIGSGRACSIREVAEELCRVTARTHLAPQITREHRVGDIRHCFADISAARRVLEYEPQVSLADGLQALAGWLETQTPPDGAQRARQELVERGLTV